MSNSKSRSKSQIKSDKRALKKLRDSGLFRGKIDLRKPPSKGAAKALAKFADVFKGKATVVQPKNPKSYKDIFQVSGKNVVVPRRKGEKVKVSKDGIIESVRKVGRRTVKSTYGKTEGVARPGKQKQYAIPFIRGRDSKGRPSLHWFRFPSYDDLKKFMQGYDYKNWTKHVVEEEIDAPEAWQGAGDLDEQYRGGAVYRKPELSPSAQAYVDRLDAEIKASKERRGKQAHGLNRKRKR